MENSSQSGDTQGILPLFTLNGFSLQLPSASTTLPQISSPVPRIPAQPKRSGKLVRPSTASAVEERLSLLPSAPNGTIVEVISPDSSPRGEPVQKAMTQGAQDEEKKDISFKNPFDGSSHPTLGSLPSPFDGGATEDITPTAICDPPLETIIEYDYDWATFMSAYAAGRWDPRRTPNPPRAYFVMPSHHSYSQSTSTDQGLDAWTTLAHESSDVKGSTSPSVSVGSRDQPTSKNSQITVADDKLRLIPPENMAKRTGLPLKLPASTIQSLRNSFSDLRIHSAHTSSAPPDQIVTPSNPELTTTAATMRWAAARVNLAPLALPSPEHELTDPMRGVTASIPGTHNNPYPSTEPITPGGTRKARLGSFWEGTQDIEDIRPGRLSTIEGSPSESVQDTPASTDSEPSQPPVPFPASAPLARSTEEPSGDYFSGPGASQDEKHLPLRESPPIIRRPTSPLTVGTASVPALPRRVCLARQVSSPLPDSTRRQPYSHGRGVSNNKAPSRMSRAAKEEQMFAELGYLAPPNPPDEWERRRALSKFNIWNTGPDLNFDRIAHLAKLVFNTKGVYISLVDGDEHNFLKSKWGMSLDNCRRVHTFCAHVILQRGDEPMVILDTQSDWRFANHPYVTGPPKVRFYAGAPLRTQEGHNIGTLSIVDDSAREDFSPRQRHTLKEFAAIAMREMELWRDKIQLRIRDRIQTSMEQFSRECLEIETTVKDHIEKRGLTVGASMERVYDRAAKLVKRTLDVEGVIVVDISHCEVLETMSAEGAVSVAIHHGDPRLEMKTRSLSPEEYSKLASFFSTYRDGKISEGIVPSALRTFLPTRIQYALTVPIFNIDKRPFALLCAYNSADHPNRFLEGHELSYLRAIGVIILSAVLKRRMILADKAKSLFISNISHELRTPLHGILAAAELLTDTPLDVNQMSFLQTVQACGTSLVETVNHVLDFTKLSGNSRSGGVEHVITPSKVDLMQLVEDAIDGGWIGHLARMSAQNSEIGSVYSPPTIHQQPNNAPQTAPGQCVETIIEIGYREKGWLFKCERGGIRRILMNLLGNSLKFTTDGFVHVGLRQLPHTDEVPENHVKIELSVLDTGKGISQNFLKNQLFHPFSQENPLQTGTGLGLAIVNSIVQSDSVGGKVDVWSEEGIGTEIKVIFTAEAVDDSGYGSGLEPLNFHDPAHPPSVSLVAFEAGHKGVELLQAVLSRYLVTWWGFVVQQDDTSGDIVIINEDPTPVQVATRHRDIRQPFIILSASRGDVKLLAVANDHERIGGFCRVLYKPGGPSRLRSALKICLNILKIRSKMDNPSPRGDPTGLPSPGGVEVENLLHQAPPYDSRETGLVSLTKDPILTAQLADVTGVAKPSSSILPSTSKLDEPMRLPDQDSPFDLETSSSPTISIGSGGSLLKSSVGIVNAKDLPYRVLVVEDNSILRNLIKKWLKAKGHEFRDAVDGRDGVNVYESEGPFDIVLLDLSMPKLDGIGATVEIRQIESARRRASDKQAGGGRAGILALTGMSSLEDKRKAFDAGVDGYLVKPVAFKTLEEMFQKLRADEHL